VLVRYYATHPGYCGEALVPAPVGMAPRMPGRRARLAVHPPDLIPSGGEPPGGGGGGVGGGGRGGGGCVPPPPASPSSRRSRRATPDRALTVRIHMTTIFDPWDYGFTVPDRDPWQDEGEAG
jgi:hypothetical protein